MWFPSARLSVPAARPTRGRVRLSLVFLFESTRETRGVWRGACAHAHAPACPRRAPPFLPSALETTSHGHAHLRLAGLAWTPLLPRTSPRGLSFIVVSAFALSSRCQRDMVTRHRTCAPPSGRPEMMPHFTMPTVAWLRCGRATGCVAGADGKVPMRRPAERTPG